MKTVTIGKHKVQLYESIDELPIKRFHKFNKFMLIDSGIGSDLSDFNAHIARIASFIKSDEKLALKELENLRQSLYMISEEVNTRHLSLVPMIYSIDGELVTDLSEENAAVILDKLQDAKTGWLNNFIEVLKKKLDDELELYFPSLFDDASVKDYYDRLKNRVLLQLDSIIRGNDNTEKITEIDDFLLSLAKPKVFSGKGSVEIAYNKQFEDMALFLAKNLNVVIDTMTVLQFYNSFVYLKKQMKQNNGR